MPPSGSFFDGELPPPDFVAIETTKYCNLRCEMCLQFQDGTTVTGPHMAIEDFEKWAGQVFPFVTRFQPSVSGEPLMSKRLPVMLKLAQDHGVKIEMTSNGTLLNERLRKMVIPVLGRITISFDGGTKEIFEAMREGGDFDKVCENVRALCREVAELPEEQRPIVDLLCVLRRLNVRDLVNLVDLAHELGVSMLHFTHMYPPTEKLKSDSLVHEPELAQDYIARALKRAKELGLTLTVQPLDQLTAASATSSGGGRRHYSTENGVVKGLEAKSVGAGGWPSWPVQFSPNDPELGNIQARREAAWQKTEYPHPLSSEGSPGRSTDKRPVKDKHLPDSIWHCDYLWNKTYFSVFGHVTPCCVPGAPAMANLADQPFDKVWNSKQYKRMRLSMALKDPVSFCKGCQHIHEVTDKDAIRTALQGQRLPDPESIEREEVAPREFQWEGARNARGYEVEFSLDGFSTILFSSSWHEPLLETNRYAVPAWAAEQAPRGQAIFWRAFALLDTEDETNERFEVGQGMLNPIQ